MYRNTELPKVIRKEAMLYLVHSSHIAHVESHTKEKYLARVHVVFPKSGFDSQLPGVLSGVHLSSVHHWQSGGWE